MRDERESRPAGNRAAIKSVDELVASIPQSPDNRQALRPARPHLFAVLVVAERADGVLVSQVFMSLDAAERKVQRTRERGLSASLTLVRITAVPFLTAEDLALVGGEQ